MVLVKCEECGHDVSTKAQACPNCRAPVNNIDKTPYEERIFLIHCESCGKEVSKDAGNCPNCGHPTTPMRKRIYETWKDVNLITTGKEPEGKSGSLFQKEDDEQTLSSSTKKKRDPFTIYIPEQGAKAPGCATIIVFGLSIILIFLFFIKKVLALF